MTAPNKSALTDRQLATLEDLIGCPGLFAGQYDALDEVARMFVERRYIGAAGFIGLAKAYPTEAARSLFGGEA